MNCLSNFKIISHYTNTQFLHWLSVKERIEYKVLSLTYSCLQFHQPSHLSDILTVQSNTYYTRSSTSVTLKRPAVVRRSKRSRLNVPSFTVHQLCGILSLRHFAGQHVLTMLTKFLHSLMTGPCFT